MTPSTVANPVAPSGEQAPARIRLGEWLVSHGKLTARDLDRALLAQSEMGDLIGRVLVRLGLVADIDVVRALAQQLQLPLVLAADFPDVLPEVPGLLPDFARTHGVCPLRLDDTGLTVALATPQDTFVLKALRLATGLAIHPCVALEADIEKALTEATTKGTTLVLEDVKGRKVLLPAAQISYIEIGEPSARKVGFGAS